MTAPAAEPPGDTRRTAGRLPLLIALAGVLLAAYLLLAVACGTPRVTPDGGDSCYDRVVHHAARLADC